MTASIWTPVIPVLSSEVLNVFADSSNVNKGDALLAVKLPALGAVSRTQHEKNSDLVSVKDFGAVGDGLVDDTIAIQSATTAINAVGGGTLFFPKGTYKIWTDGALLRIGNFINCSGVNLIGEGAKIIVNTVPALNEFPIIFFFSNCTNITVTGFEVIGPQAAYFENWNRGARFVYLTNGCKNVNLPLNKVSGANSALMMVRNYSTEDETTVCRNIQVGTLSTENVGYPINGQFSGWNLVINNLDCVDSHRSLFIYGVSNVTANVRSKNPHGGDLYLKGVQGYGLDNININYTNTESDNPSNDNGQACVTIAPNSTLPVILRNIRLNLNIQYPTASAYTPKLFWIFKQDSNDNFDPIDRGHRLEHIVISGTLTSNSTAYDPINICGAGSGVWGSGEAIIGLTLENLIINSSRASTINLTSNAGSCSLKNVQSLTAPLYLTNGSTLYRLPVINCIAPEFTTSVGSGGLIDWINTTISAGVTTSTYASEMLGAVVGGQVRSNTQVSAVNQVQYRTAYYRAGNQTSALNIFKVFLMGARVACRLKYYLQDGTGGVTIGIKSFVAQLSTNGIWTINIPVGNDVAERTAGTASALTVNLLNGNSTGGFIQVSATNYNQVSASGDFELEIMAQNQGTQFSKVVGPV